MTWKSFLSLFIALGARDVQDSAAVIAFFSTAVIARNGDGGRQGLLLGELHVVEPLHAAPYVENILPEWLLLPSFDTAFWPPDGFPAPTWATLLSSSLVTAFLLSDALVGSEKRYP